MNVSGDQLIASNGSTAVTAKVQSYGTRPTATTTATPLITLATSDAVNGFALFDLSPTIPGDDTMYLLSTVENLFRKYTFDGTSWAASGSIAASATQNLTGFTSGAGVSLFLTSPGSLFAFSDTSGYGGTLSGSLGGAIATAAPNTAFRGVGLVPVPEPTALTFGLAGVALLLGRRRRS